MPEGIIIKALSGFYYVKSDDRIIQCRGRGVFRKKNITPLVGDYVVFQAESNEEGYILDIKERKNELIRPPIANIEQAILIFSAKEPDLNLVLLNRFLVVIEANNIVPVIVISKIDLLSDNERKEIELILSTYEKIGYKVLYVSAATGEGVDQLKLILSNQISVFAGQSGVGKSSLLNALDPSLQLKTGEISSSLGRGRHTTRHVELISFGNGYIADTPGFSSLEFIDIEVDELSNLFPEMKELSAHCKFRGCIHENEPSCAVKLAVETGEVSEKRYEHYLQFLAEIRERKPRY